VRTFTTLLIVAGLALALGGWPISGIGAVIAGLVVRPASGRLIRIRVASR
jgi:hypothetical protein